MTQYWVGRNQTSKLSTQERFWEKVDVRSSDECWEWQGFITPKGYGHFRVDEKGMTRVHRFSWELYNKKSIPVGMMVLHECDNRKCVNPKHLFLGTNDDNMKDMKRKGRAKNVPMFGADNPNTKLTVDDVKEIRRIYSSGNCTYYDLANKFNISYQHVGDIVNRKKWNHV